MLCNADHEKNFRIDFLDAKDDGNHKLIGSITTNLVSNGQSLNHSFGYGSKVECVKFSVEPVVNFIEYIFGGCQIALSVAIDFTGSNGPIMHPHSLHSLNPAKN